MVQANPSNKADQPDRCIEQHCKLRLQRFAAKQGKCNKT